MALRDWPGSRVALTAGLWILMGVALIGWRMRTTAHVFQGQEVDGSGKVAGAIVTVPSPLWLLGLFLPPLLLFMFWRRFRSGRP